MAARERERVLRGFLEFRRDAIRQGERGPTRAYAIPPARDAALHAKLGKTLVAKGVEVHRAEVTFAAASKEFPKGTLFVPLAQPAGLLARNLLDRDIPLPDDYLDLQRERRAKRYPAQVYDISAWSLPPTSPSHSRVAHSA